MSAYISVELQKQIRDKFANCCAYCLTAEFLTATTFEFEHIIPRSSGGETVVENLCLACPSCNRYKAVRAASVKENRQNVIDRVTEQTIPFFHPHNPKNTIDLKTITPKIDSAKRRLRQRINHDYLR